MGHHLRLFVAHPQVLVRFRAALPAVRLHALQAGAKLAVLSLDDDLHDALHRAYGTGEWLDMGAVWLTTTDIAFAARASQAGALAYIETDYAGGAGQQSAALWSGGDLALKPTTLDASAVGNRPRSTWPVNAALRGLGVQALGGLDEFDSFGLGAYRSHDDIVARALPLRAD
jgi:hypothetical protein